MKTIKIVLSAFAMLAMVSFSNAQSAEQVTENKERTEKIIKHLELSEEQAVKARELSDKYFALISNAKTDIEKKNYTGEAENEVKKLLTEEQYKKYRAYVATEQNPKQVQRIPRTPVQKN